MLQRRQCRRSFLFTLAAGSPCIRAQSGRSFPSEAVRYADPATEFTIVRLTDPQYSSYLPDSGNRVMTTRGLLYASDRSGAWQAMWMDWRSRSSRQVSDAGNLDPGSLALQANDKGFWYFDGPSLVEAPLTSAKKTREIYRRAEGISPGDGVCFQDSTGHAAFIETSATQFTLRLLDLASGAARTLVESSAQLEEPRIRPRHRSVLYKAGGGIAMIDFDGRQERILPLAEGETLHAQWSGEGATLLYLNRPPDPRKLTNLREWNPETGMDTRIADTSQFVDFAPNGNASAFIGASGSKASPYILLLIRAAKRELTLAEHRASDARMTAPQFSPNSQFICFQSDRHGKPAIYWIPVDKLVTETDGS